MTNELLVKVDSHCHITSDEMFEDVDEVIARAKEAGVNKIVNICTDPKTLERGIALQKKYPDVIFNTVATTPHDVEKDGKLHFETHKEAIVSEQICGVGETGLDYYYEHSNRELQKHFLQAYFTLAIENNLPVVIHCRGDEAFSDLFAIAKEVPPPAAVLHCFTGSHDHVEKLVDLGWYVSASGIVTFKKSEELREVFKQVPLENLFIETDAPYLAPQSKRGKRNEPSYVGEVAEVLAKVKGVAVSEVTEAATKNTCAFFQI